MVDKYGGNEELIQQLPQIYQDKLAEEKIRAAVDSAQNPPQTHNSTSRQSEVGVPLSSSEEMPPPQPAKKQ